jgi:hypothetical protein
MTAVEWLVNCIESMDWGEITTRKELYAKAKEMEKEQIINTYLKDRKKGDFVNALKLMDKAEEYYNEKFKSE